MMQSKHKLIRVRILVKAFPQPSKSYEETVCCAGISEDGRLLRLYPIRYRRLPTAHRFSRFDLVEMLVTKATDPRPESYRVDENSIRLVERSRLTDRAKVRLWMPFISPSLKQLHAENVRTEQSLGIICPDRGSVKFNVKAAEDSDPEDKDVSEQVRRAQQNSFLEDSLTPLEKPEFAFGYKFKSNGSVHNHVIHDWEVQEAYRNYKRRYRNKALEHLQKMYGETIPADNLHFMGTMGSHRRTFIIIGLLRSPFDPAELRRQIALV